ncbi:MAG: hypothetical protein AAGM38_19190, partial [Pseudomonadota bacterium]
RRLGAYRLRTRLRETPRSAPSAAPEAGATPELQAGTEPEPAPARRPFLEAPEYTQLRKIDDAPAPPRFPAGPPQGVSAPGAPPPPRAHAASRRPGRDALEQALSALRRGAGRDGADPGENAGEEAALASEQIVDEAAPPADALSASATAVSGPLAEAASWIAARRAEVAAEAARRAGGAAPQP